MRSRDRREHHGILTGVKAEQDKLVRFPSGHRYILQKNGSVVNPDRQKLTKSQKRKLKSLRIADRLEAQKNLSDAERQS